ncbi:unnamed protein product, partial [Brenthis ino]
MTVRPGRHYCGEHEPQPRSCDGKNDDTRVPCPNDPKHTCYASKLEKHLSICNARKQEQPSYIIQNINAPTQLDECARLPLNQIPLDTILKCIEKVNLLYDGHLKDKIKTLPEKPIHACVREEFNEVGRTESSLRHLRQASQLLHLLEEEQLVAKNTCYVELGAGKGHLSYYAWKAWCQDGDSAVLLVDRASLRHKRDNKLRGVGGVQRLRADLAHLALARVPAVRRRAAVVAYAKHLCGVAMDYALRCVASAGSGAALATCCHHRCARAAAVAAPPLQELGINDEDFNVMLGVVSWATCGDGRSRRRRAAAAADVGAPIVGTKNLNLDRAQREQIGRRAKALLDWGRVLYLKEHGFDARLVYYVPTSVSLENVCIIAKKIS